MKRIGTIIIAAVVNLFRRMRKNDIRAVCASLFAVAAAMLMCTAVFAQGSGTKDDPYIVKDEAGFVYYCQQGGYVKVEAEELNIDSTQINIIKDLDLDMGNCVCTMDNGIFNRRIFINQANVTISSEKYGGICLTGSDDILFYVNLGSLTLNGGIYTNAAKRTIVGANSTITLNGTGALARSGELDSDVGIGVDDINISGGKLTVNNGWIHPYVNYMAGHPAFNSYPVVIENAGFEFNGSGISDIKITENTAAENIILRSGSFEHILVESSDYNISDLLDKDSYIAKYGEDRSLEKINADVKELTGDISNNYIIISPMKVSDADVSITPPKAGEMPDMAAVINTDGVTLYETEPVTWYKDGAIMKDSDVFEAGHRYGLSVWLQAQDGYRFATDESLSPEVAGSLNGEAAVINMAYEQEADKVIELSYDFGTLQKNILTDAEITINAPQAGNTPDFSPEITQGCVFKTPSTALGNSYWYNGIRWFDESESVYMKPEDKFVKGHDYTLQLNFKADDFTAFNIKNAAINGHSVDVYGSSEIRIEYTFKEGLMGDVDKNGFVDEADAAVLMKYITGIEPVLSELQLEAAKVTDNEKDKPDMLDVIAILKIVENSL
ncbi:MAG: hypothetical protein IJ583_16330 [Firmicutes bacterium]|nr:hypothetical protein [Bacillota bacterium]